MQNKPKILLITLRADPGGAPLHVDNIMIGLAVKMNFYCASPLNEPFGLKWKKTLGNNFFEMPHRKFSVTALLGLLKFIKSNTIEIIHSHGKGAGVYSRIIKIFIPKVATIHTYHGLHLPKNYLSRKFYLTYETIFTRFSDLCINVSSSEQNKFIERGILKSNKAKVINNGIENILLKNTDSNSIKLKLNLPADKIIVICAARLSYQKNIEELLNIAKLFLLENHFLFIVLGDGEEKKTLEEIKSKKEISNVLFLGSKENINEHLLASDIYLTTSRWEGLPYSLLEAARASLPFVGSNVTGNIEVIQNNINGFLYEAGDILRAQECLSKLANDKIMRREFGKASRLIFESKFVLNKMLSEIEKVYYSFI